MKRNVPPEPDPAIRDNYKPLKSVDGQTVGYVCIECGRLHTAPHLEWCTRQKEGI